MENLIGKYKANWATGEFVCVDELSLRNDVMLDMPQICDIVRYSEYSGKCYECRICCGQSVSFADISTNCFPYEDSYCAVVKVEGNYLAYRLSESSFTIKAAIEGRLIKVNVSGEFLGYYKTGVCISGESYKDLVFARMLSK